MLPAAESFPIVGVVAADELADKRRPDQLDQESRRAGYGLVAHLAPDTARRLRAALAAALRELGEDPGA